MCKCSAIWTCAAKPNSGEIIEEDLSGQLRYPGPKHWNSPYECHVQSPS